MVLDIGDAIRGIAPLIERSVGERVRVEWALADDTPPVEMDPVQLERILMNLAVNARDAMPTGGTLRFTTRVELGDEPTRDPAPRFTVIEVTDTGIGMDEATRARIFEPFFSTKGRLGTGLGLATVEGIVDQSGGRLAVESEPGVGTTFRIVLPEAAESGTPRAPTRTTPARSPAST